MVKHMVAERVHNTSQLQEDFQIKTTLAKAENMYQFNKVFRCVVDTSVMLWLFAAHFCLCVHCLNLQWTRPQIKLLHVL